LHTVQHSLYVPESLRERPGSEATRALREFVDAKQQDWSGQVLSVATDRFECRLTAEVSAVRREFHEGLAAVAGLINLMIRPGR
jgi:hypothetical protein